MLTLQPPQSQNDVTDIIIDDAPGAMEVEELPNVHERERDRLCTR